MKLKSKNTEKNIKKKLTIRSAHMALIKSKNTNFEISVFKSLKKKGVRFQTHLKGLPGTPDIVLIKDKKAVFLDSDFWHGWHYPNWRNKKLSPFWTNKIENNIKMDRKNIKNLKKLGWKVLRIWEHQLKKNNDKYIEKIETFLK